MCLLEPIGRRLCIRKPPFPIVIPSTAEKGRLGKFGDQPGGRLSSADGYPGSADSVEKLPAKSNFGYPGRH
ncbi:hypothetical protein BCAR13_440032 [Paraburkholderia caribensis]|nr:hypothetical protein BCAR13_440032 [Paraburkholderia caribensis]